MKQSILSAFRDEMQIAKTSYKSQNYDTCFRHLERAHILGQRYFLPHMITHWWMLKIGLQRTDIREIFGQVTRMIAVIPGYLFGWVPKGNTGGANVSPIKPMPIPEDFSTLLKDYKVGRDVLVRVGIWIAALSVVSLFLD